MLRMFAWLDDYNVNELKKVVKAGLYMIHYTCFGFFRHIFCRSLTLSDELRLRYLFFLKVLSLFYS